ASGRYGTFRRDRRYTGRRMHRRRAALAAAVVASLALTGAASARASLAGTPVPPGFVGMNVDGPMIGADGGVAMPSQFDAMRAHGVQSLRVSFNWASAQPYASSSDLSPSQKGQFVSGAGGVPTNFAATDQIVQLAAAHGMSVLPVVIYTPSWDVEPGAGGGLARPHIDYWYGAYLTTLIGRYGPHGSFWSDHPTLSKRPIRMWEIWNEPDIVGYWPTQPFAKTYVALLRAAHAAIK